MIFRLAHGLKNALEVSEHGRQFAFASELLSNYVRKVTAATLTDGEKIWGVFAGQVLWITLNRMDRTTRGGTARLTGKPENRIDGTLKFDLTKETVQLNYFDSLVHV